MDYDNLPTFEVGPQEYIFTSPGVIGTNSSFWRVSVL